VTNDIFMLVYHKPIVPDHHGIEIVSIDGCVEQQGSSMTIIRQLFDIVGLVTLAIASVYH
jgi:hypothetical protein